MYVNVSRSQSLINKKRFAKSAASDPQMDPAPRCRHCGGLIRPSEGLNSCMMCSRMEGHQCERCAHGQPA